MTAPEEDKKVSNRSRWQKVLLGVFLAALTVHIRWPYVAVGVVPISDFGHYQSGALDILHHGFEWAWGKAGNDIAWNFWPPLWPTWLASLYTIFGSDYHVGLQANLILAVCSGALLLLIGERIAKGAGFIAWGIWAIAPGITQYTGVLASENLAIPLLLLALYLVLRRIWWGAGLVAGLLILCRVSFLPIAALMIPAAWLKERKLKPCLVYGCLTMLIVLPWSINRSLVNGRFVPITVSSGFNLWMANHPSNDWGGWIPAQKRGSYDSREPYLDKALQAISNHPGHYAFLIWRRGLTWVGNTHSPFACQEWCPGDKIREAHLERNLRPIWFLFALVGTAIAWQRRNKKAILIAICYWVYAASLITTCLMPRYILSAIPLVCLLAGTNLILAFQKETSPTKSQLPGR